MSGDSQHIKNMKDNIFVTIFKNWILILCYIGMISCDWHLILPPKRAMPNYLTCGILDILSNVKHFTHLKWSERPQLLNEENG